MRWMIIFLFPLCLLGQAAQQAAKFAENQCRSVPVSKGEIGKGQLKYCDNGTDQEIYLSGELYLRPTDRNMNSAADFLALKKILREFKKRDKGTFRVVTNMLIARKLATWQTRVQSVFRFDQTRRPPGIPWDGSIHLLAKVPRVSKTIQAWGQTLNKSLLLCFRALGWSCFQERDPRR